MNNLTETLSAEEKKQGEIRFAEQGIGTYVYNYSSAKKQSQDLMWTNYHRTNLVAAGEADVEAKVVGFAQAVIGGKTIAQAIKSVNADFKPAYTKLVKIALRTSWARQCIDEGLTALAESREPEYPPFPEL